MSDPFNHLRPRAAEDVLGRIDGGECCHDCNRVVHPDDLVEVEGEKICGWCLKEQDKDDKSLSTIIFQPTDTDTCNR